MHDDCAADRAVAMRRNGRTNQDRAICLPDFHHGRRLKQILEKLALLANTSLRDTPVTRRLFPAAISIKTWIVTHWIRHCGWLPPLNPMRPLAHTKTGFAMR
ncbi:hypothetical protein D3C72_1549220 [compost metagenome]